ncbi:MAG: hypothetical protein ACK44M_03420 [Chloroflexus sp.]
MAVEIEIQIDEIVLLGFERLNHERVKAALVAELSRLLAEEGMPEGLNSDWVVATLDGGVFRVTPGMRPEQIGQQIALALYREWR